ncbi:MAG: hypothetical protein NTU61_02130, partial [Candidatus Altiarchaeota archaeon]|nr:hypothetical protein [Candidatus Altiarchaeota archaeon]
MGKVVEGGGAKASIDGDSGTLSLKPKSGEALLYSFRDLVDISPVDYTVELVVSSGEKLVLTELGYSFEDFVRVLSKLRNELLIKDMLMEESEKASGIEAEYVFCDESGVEKSKGNCSLRFYETAVVLIPEKGSLVRIPYGEVSDFKAEDYSLTISSEQGRKLVLSKMGRRFDYAVKSLSDCMNELSLKTQMILKELIPGLDPAVVRKASRVMRDGRAATKSELASVSPDLWAKLEKRVSASAIKESYEFLKSLGQKDKISIGLKRGLMGDLTGEYIWFLIPIYGLDSKTPGNAVAMEAVNVQAQPAVEGTEESSPGGHATYFFRISGRSDYKTLKSIEELESRVDSVLKTINSCMRDINFRREPIYLPDESLDAPEYVKYKYSIQAIPSL